MKKHILSFLFFCCIGSYVSSDEISGLLSIKASLIDSLNHLQDWKVSSVGGEANGEAGSVHCSWKGVWCNEVGSVVRLDLSHMNLSGVVSKDIQELRSLVDLNLCGNGLSSSLPKSMFNLTHLKYFDVSQNYFVGDFPSGVGTVEGLTYVNASSNSFSGFLPEEIGNLTSLEVLDFRGSFFEGPIPTAYKALSKLKYLGLAGNNLTGAIPGELGQLESLETIILGYNDFQGGIPPEFGNLSNLRYLDLAIGNLEGRIPAEMGKLQKLETVYLYQNSLEGKIPTEIGNMKSLLLLDLSDNQLSGSIPAELSKLKNLQLLNVMRNRLTGWVPPGLGDLKELNVLELWNNSLSGPLPANLGQNSHLQWLDVSSNSFTGEIPAGLCNGGNLTKLILFNNAFTGPIPSNLSTCSSLVRVRMQNNLISGTIPTGFGKLAKLQRLELANNNLTGKIPNDISFSTSLSFIDLSQNHLQSSLPTSIFLIPTLQNFLVSNNNLNGEIPDQFQDCPSLAVVDLSSNSISGSIPASIASCEKLVTLNLRNNIVSGQIPSAISKMSTLAILDLSTNSLTGTLPESFGSSPALEMLNVSYNKLEGRVPSNGMLVSINPNDLIGNVGLCGGVLPPCSQSSSITVSKEKKLHIKHIIAGWIAGISAILALAIIICSGMWMYKRWYANGGCFTDRFNVGTGEWPWRLMAFQRINFTTSEILACIKESNVIGMGASGIVYKAEIQRPHSVVAVKRLWNTGPDVETGSNNDLVGEINLLGRLRHRNIVRLYGYLHKDNDVMMVYEYVPNGNLWEALHGKMEGRVLVDWVSRYNIAVGLAQGLAYLHHDCHPPVVHRDIKSNNILLDSNLEARIADFGLARMLVRKNETMSMVAGSHGYIAPEYGYTLKVDEKSDIYSFGVVLMELLIGKRPLEPEFGESVDIVEWVRVKIRNKIALQEALDPSIGSQCKLVEEEMLLVLQIALLCTAKFPKDRPSMRDVITMLGEAKPRRKSSSNNSTNNDNREKPIFSMSPVTGLL